MPRPCKKRNISVLPRCTRFLPDIEKIENTIVLSLDEYEVIRLIDLEGLNQTESAKRLQVAPSTINAIYSSARKKLAQFLLMQTELRIEGGHTHYDKQQEEKIMRIAVPYENEEVFQHFGHTEQFKIYNLMNGKIVSSFIQNTEGKGHAKLAEFLKENSVDILLCGGIGQGARNALQQAKITLFPGVMGKVDEAVMAYLEGSLMFNADFVCDHHSSEEGHDCQEHECHCH